MSINTLNGTFYVQSLQHDKCFIVQTGREALAEYVDSQMKARNWSFGDVARESGTFKLSTGTVWNVVNLRVKDVKEHTLRGIAKAFKVPEVEVFEIYYGKKKFGGDDLSDDEEIAALFYEYKDLTEEDKEELRTVMEMVRQEIRRRKQAGELASQRKAREKASKRR
jgi:transcriptional regulator with XRE-family HTH domain